MYFSIQVNGDV